jgi:acid stress-induced BolA-like protein IbaG/YrbA
MRAYIEDIHILLKKEFWESVEIDFKDEQGDGKHFFLDICSEKFIWKSRIEQSQMVYNVLDPYMKTWFIHALRMKCRIPQ